MSLSLGEGSEKLKLREAGLGPVKVRNALPQQISSTVFCYREKNRAFLGCHHGSELKGVVSGRTGKSSLMSRSESPRKRQGTGKGS